MRRDTESAAGSACNDSEAEIELRDTSVAAPSMSTSSRRMSSWAPLSVLDPVLVLAKTNVVKIVIGVLTRLLRSISWDSRLMSRWTPWPIASFQARISRIASAADPKTRNFEIEIAIPNRDHALEGGWSVPCT